MDFPKRKHIRLKAYDYTSLGSYHTIIHLRDDAPVLSTICRYSSTEYMEEYPRKSLCYPGGYMTDLTDFGRICFQVMKNMEQKYADIQICNYVYMPDHIHFLIEIQNSTDVSLADYIREFKSVATIQFNKVTLVQGRRYFQTSFYEHIIRGERDWQETMEYIDCNPGKIFHFECQ